MANNKNGRAGSVPASTEQIAPLSHFTRYTLNDVPTAPLKTVLDCLYQDEYGDALLFAHLFQGKCIYDHTSREWYLWSGHYWKADTTKGIYGFVMGLLSSVYIKASAELNLQIKAIDNGKDSTPLPEDEESEKEKSKQQKLRDVMKKLQARAHSLKMKSRMLNVLELATSMLDTTSDKWDSLDMMLGTANGVLDLRTGLLRAGKPDDYIKTIIRAKWTGLHTQAPRFQQFLEEIFDDRPEKERTELIDFLQIVLGYAITGKGIEQVFLMLFGEEGRNGKDTLMTMIKKVMGDIVGAISNDVLLSAKNPTPGAAKPHWVALQGKRLAWASETEKGERFAIGQVKFLTGSPDEIPARALYGKEYTFKPSHLLILLTNNKPHADAKDDAFWNRLCPIVFNNRFVKNPDPTKPNERLADVRLTEKLEAEISGILAWLVRGAQKWNSVGLQIPDCILRERAKYREDEDTLGIFLNVTCYFSPDYKIASSVLYRLYETWTQENNLKPMSGTSFSTEMAKTYPKKRESAGFFFHGLGHQMEYSEPLAQKAGPVAQVTSLPAHTVGKKSLDIEL